MNESIGEYQRLSRRDAELHELAQRAKQMTQAGVWQSSARNYIRKKQNEEQNRRLEEQTISILTEKSEQVEKRELCEAKTIICFLGPPGGGKSWEINELRKNFNLPATHIRDFIKKRGADKFEQILGGLSEYNGGKNNFEQDFLNYALADKGRAVILDGFPRSPQQAHFLIDQAKASGHNLIVVHLYLPTEDSWPYLSMRRQVDRDQKKNQKLNYPKFLAKIERTIESDMLAIADLRALGATIIDVNAAQSKEGLYQNIHSELKSLVKLNAKTKKHLLINIISKICSFLKKNN